MGTSRALRVALIQHGRIVEDRTFTDRAKITVGTGEKSTFLVPMAEVPVSTTVFDISKHGTSLLFDSNTDGKLSVSGAEAPLYKYVDRASQKGTQLSLPLPDDAKGRVSIGEISLLFQFVEPPKRHTPAPLPKGSKGFIAQIDRAFLAILALSLAAHYAGMGWIAQQPLPEERELSVEEMIPDRWAAVMLPKPKPPKKTEPDKPAVAEAPKPTPKPNPTTQPPTQPTKVASRPTGEALKQRLKSMGMLAVIGANGDEGSGIGDIMKDSGTTDVAKAMRELGPDGMKVASAEEATGTKRKGGDTGETTDIEPIGTPGVKRVDLVDNGPRKPPTGPPGPPDVKPEKPIVKGDIDEKELTRWLNQRKPAIQNCYERQLKRTPTLAGRVVIRFEITTRGRVGGVGFTEDTLRNAIVEDCISGMMRGWVLPFEPEDDVPVALPYIFEPGH